MSELTDAAQLAILPALNKLESDAATAAAAPLAAQVAVLNGQVSGLTADVAARDKTIADLQAAAPVARKTLFGSNPGTTAGTSTASIRGIVTKFPGASYARLFGGLPGAVASVAGVQVHESFSCEVNGVTDCAGVVAGKYDAGIRAAALSPGSPWLTFKHEPNDELADGVFTIEEYRAAWSHFAQVARAANPKVVLVLVVMAKTFDPAQAGNPEPFAGIPADVLGIDCDGSSPKNGVYPDYSYRVLWAASWAHAHGMRLAIPEFGAPRDPSDTSGAKRATWMTYWAGVFRALNVDAVGAWDTATNGKAFPLTTAAELAAWRSAVTG